MDQVVAAENITIDIDADQWRMRDADVEIPVVVATHEGLRYTLRFGETRRLPQSGLLRPDDVMQVVLGWQNSDQSWHLGLIVSPELTAKRGSRWCELAYWHDPTQEAHRGVVEAAGEALAEQLDISFLLVPPELPANQQQTPLDPLPLSCGWWTLHRASETETGRLSLQAEQLVLKRGFKWRLTKFTRMLWYGFWMIVYILLSTATLTSELALPNAGTLLPNPQLLPYLGLGVAGLLFVLILHNIYLLLTRYDIIVVDPRERSLSAYKGRRRVWHVGTDEAQSLYVTEVVKRRQKKANTEHGELNLHLGNKQFRFVLQQGEPINSDTPIPEDERKHRSRDEVYPLRRENAYSQLQMAALYLSEGLGSLPVWYDMRMK
jgi:hypothetical protein